MQISPGLNPVVKETDRSGNWQKAVETSPGEEAAIARFLVEKEHWRLKAVGSAGELIDGEAQMVLERMSAPKSCSVVRTLLPMAADTREPVVGRVTGLDSYLKGSR